MNTSEKKVRVLVGAPVHECKAYAIQSWVESVKKIRSYSKTQGIDVDLAVSDNSPTKDFSEKIRAAHPEVTVLYAGNLPTHPVIPIHARIANSENQLRYLCLKGGYDYFFSVECDVLPEPRALVALLEKLKRENLGAVQGQFYTGYDRKMWAGHKFFLMGISLIDRITISKINFRIDANQDNKFPDAFFGEDMTSMKVPYGFEPNVVAKHLEDDPRKSTGRGWSLLFQSSSSPSTTTKKVAFGVCLGDAKRYRDVFEVGFKRVPQDQAILFVEGEPGRNDSIFSVYNRILDKVKARGDVDALVLAHEDLEIRDPKFLEKVRTSVSLPDVAIAGTVGGQGVHRVGWWWAATKKGYALDSHAVFDYGFSSIDVDVVDGLMLVFSPWAIQNLRFDEARYSGFHAYDADICQQARVKGKRVIVQKFDIKHHCKSTVSGGQQSFDRNDEIFRRKWGFAPLSPSSSAVAVSNSGASKAKTKESTSRRTTVTKRASKESSSSSSLAKIVNRKMSKNVSRVVQRRKGETIDSQRTRSYPSFSRRSVVENRRNSEAKVERSEMVRRSQAEAVKRISR